MAGPLPPNIDPRKLAGMMQTVPIPQPVKVTVRMQLLRQIEIGERAKEALELLDNNPIIQTFLNKVEQ